VVALLAVLVLFSCWQLLLAWMALIGVISVIAPMQQAFMTGKTEAEQQAAKGKEDTSKMAVVKKSANNIVGDAVIGIRTVASFNLEHQFYDTFCKANGTVSRYEIQDSFVSAFFLALTMYVTMGLMGLVFWYSIYLSNRGETDLEGVMAPMMAMTGLMPAIMKMGALADMKVCTRAAVKLFALFDRTPAIDNLDTTPGAEPNVLGAIELRDITFAYPTALDQLVCKGYSLSIAAGQTVALCGPSGSGKSTAINLIERFYDPLSGVVLLDGVDIKTLNVRWLRAQFGYVGQEPVLFQGTVAENIAHGSPGASQEAIEEAAKMANAHGFITENLADGYKTNVGLKGGKLSGGQKQRVAIARAIIKKPKVLLLDEATSALDNESERVVQAALDEIMTKQKRTTIVIAHRLSTIRRADKIAVISDGVVLEQGTHDELLANQSMYANLVMAAA
jgi:ATP-binding cassette subfamily B (MDR/TAP) protein 1